MAHRLITVSFLVVASLASCGCNGGSAPLSGGGSGSGKGGEKARENDPAVGTETADGSVATQVEGGQPVQPFKSENQRVVPPEVVSGSYLACQPVESQAISPAEGQGFYGCATFDQSGQRLDVEGTGAAFSLTDRAGQPVEATRIEIPDADLDVAWSVARTLIDQKELTGHVALPDAAGTLQRVKSCVPYILNNMPALACI